MTPTEHLEIANTFCRQHHAGPFCIDTISNELKIDSSTAYKVARAGVKSGAFVYGNDSLSFMINEQRPNH